MPGTACRATLEPVSVVKAWVESSGDVNGLFDPDARDHGGATVVTRPQTQMAESRFFASGRNSFSRRNEINGLTSATRCRK